MNISRLKLVIVIAAVAISVSACGSSKSSTPGGTGKAAATPPVETNETYIKASELFQKTNCISCHAIDLSGKVGPKTNLQKIGATRSAEQIANKIRTGGGGMPVYESKLTPEEISLLAEWLSSKK
jgi:cytochrome c551